MPTSPSTRFQRRPSAKPTGEAWIDAAEAEEKSIIAHSDPGYALSQIDSFIDFTEDDLLGIYHLATNNAHMPAMQERGNG